ncbi:MAG: mechanosensitive ion channel family protein [Armatimonadota bacterium]|nr:mechanosensitive ion channel family protein [Armatimonadota bacterium]
MPAEPGLLRRLTAEAVHPARLEAAVESLIAVAIIIVGVRAALALGVALLRRTLRPDDPRRPPDRAAQIRTLEPLLESALRYVLYFTGLIMVLDRLHFNVSALLASAGIAGLAIGFGAQHLIRDIIAGFLMLFEGLMQVGDVVRIGDTVGVVERVSLRTTQVRQYSGELVTIPNGIIQQIGNRSRGFMRALVQVGFAYEADLRRAMALMHQVGQDWAAQHADLVLGPPEVEGILEFGGSEVVVRLAVMVKPEYAVSAERQLRLALKEALDREGIEIPYPRRVVYTRPTPIPPGAEQAR